MLVIVVISDARKSHADVIEAEEVVNEEVVEKATDSQTIVNTGKVAVHDDETLYEVKFLASENCTESDIKECFAINFEEALKRIGINDERSKFEIIKVQDNHLIEEDGSRFRFLHLFKVKVKNIDPVKRIIESFATKEGSREWDDMAFNN